MASDPETAESILRSLGVPDEVIARAGRRGDLFRAFFESLPRRGAAERTVSAVEIEADGGMPAGQLRELMLAMGLPAPEPDEPAFTPEEKRAFTDLWHQQDLWPFDDAVQI